MNPHDIYRALLSVGDPDVAIAKRLFEAAGVDPIAQPQEALRTCLEGAERGNTDARHVLAKALWTGMLGPTDREQASETWRKLAASGYLPAQVAVAGLHTIRGTPGFEFSMERAVALLEDAASRGSAAAMSQLGTLYVHGTFTRTDRQRGLQFLRDAAALGDVVAQCELGSTLLEEMDSALLREGITWLEAAAKEDFAPAHSRLAALFRSGNAVVAPNEQHAVYHASQADALNDLHFGP